MSKDYSQSVVVRSTTQAAFKALTRHISDWWGNTDKPVSGLDDVFTITFGPASWTFKIV